MWAYRATGPLRFERISVARPAQADLVDGDVIVRPRVGGICGSDLPEARGLMPTRTPASGLGPLHEIVGDVVHSTGDRMQVGQRVVGWVKDQHGLSEYVIAAERQLLAVPEEFSDVDAVVAQPLACVICAVDRLGEVSGQRAVVIGQGPTGLLFDQVLVDRGAVVTGVDPVNRSALAAAMGLRSCTSVAGAGRIRRWATDGPSWWSRRSGTRPRPSIMRYTASLPAVRCSCSGSTTTRTTR